MMPVPREGKLHRSSGGAGLWILGLLLAGAGWGPRAAEVAPPPIPPEAWWPAVNGEGNHGALGQTGGALTNPTVITELALPPARQMTPLAVKVGTAPAREGSWGATAPSVTQDFDGDGASERVRAVNEPKRVVIEVQQTSDDQISIRRHLDTTHRPGLFLFEPTVADLSPDAPGDEVIFFGYWIDKQRKAADDGILGYACSFSPALGELLWEREFEEILYFPTTIVDDVNADGRHDLIAAVHYRVLVLDGATGEPLFNVRFSKGRNYALLETFQLDDDPYREILISGDFYSETTVIDLGADAAGNVVARPLWTMLFEHRIEQRLVNTYAQPEMIQIAPDGEPLLFLNFFNMEGHAIEPVDGFENPLGDIDGDGVCDGENVLGREPFYERGDGRWRTLALSAETGHVRGSIDDQWFEGGHDLNGDGQPELFMLEANGQVRPEFGRVALWTWSGREGRRIWAPEEGAGRWVKATAPFQPHKTSRAENPSAVPFVADLDGDGAAEFMILFDTDGDWNGDRLACYTVAAQGDAEPVLKWAFARPGGSLLPAEWQPGAAGASGSLRVHDRSARVSYTLNEAGEPLGDPAEWAGGAVANISPVLGDFDANGALELVAPNDLWETVIYQYDPLVKEFTESRRLPGHPLYSLNPLVADLEGDGKAEYILAQPGERGESVIVRYDAEGNAIWKRRLPPIAFGPVERGGGGLCGQPVATDANGDGVADLFLTAFRERVINNMESYMVDGATGEILWHARDVPTTQTYAMTIGSSNLMTTAELTGDDREELVLFSTLYPHLVDAATGELVQPTGLGSDVFGVDDNGVWYMSAVGDDFDGDGAADIYWYYGWHHVLTDAALKPKWYALRQMAAPQHYAATGRLQAGGGVDIVFTASDDEERTWAKVTPGEVVCLDGATGREQWSWAPPDGLMLETSPILVDVNADGLHDVVVVAGGELIALAAPPAGEPEAKVLWRLALPETRPQPARLAAADAEGDGNPEIFILPTPGSRANLLMIGNADHGGMP